MALLRVWIQFVETVINSILSKYFLSLSVKNIQIIQCFFLIVPDWSHTNLIQSSEFWARCQNHNETWISKTSDCLTYCPQAGCFFRLLPGRLGRLKHSPFPHLDRCFLVYSWRYQTVFQTLFSQLLVHFIGQEPSLSDNWRLVSPCNVFSLWTRRQCSH